MLILSFIVLCTVVWCDESFSAVKTVNCTDKSPYCNKNDCATRPGYAIEYCKKTCGNCEDFCQESEYVSCNEKAKADCEFMLRDYCPIMCGLCRPQRRKRPKNSNTIFSPSLPSFSTSTESTTEVIDSHSIIPTANTPHSNAHQLKLVNNVQKMPGTYNNSVDEKNYNLSQATLQDSTQNHPSSDNDEKKNSLLISPRDTNQQPVKVEQPRTMSIFNSGHSQQSSPFKDIEPATIPLITSFKNQIIKPEERGFPYIRSQPPEAQPLIDFTKLKKTEIRYHPHSTDYGDDSVFSEGSPLDIPSDNYFHWQHFSHTPDNHPSPIPPPYIDTASSYNPEFSIKQPNYRTSPRNKRRRIQQKLYPRQGVSIDYDMPAPSVDDVLNFASTNEDIIPIPVDTELIEDAKRGGLPSPLAIADLITLLGCRDRDPLICSKVTEESCRARPGFYLKLCPVKCRNCNGLVCMDSNKIDCGEMQRRGGCRLAMAQEYCPKTCMKCPTPPFIAEQQSPCRDELDTCEQLAESGVCDHPFSRPTLRVYCAKSCGFCKASQYYMNEYASQNQPNALKRFMLPSKN